MGNNTTTATTAATGTGIGYAFAEVLAWILLETAGVEMPTAVMGAIAVLVTWGMCHVGSEKGITQGLATKP